MSRNKRPVTSHASSKPLESTSSSNSSLIRSNSLEYLNRQNIQSKSDAGVERAMNGGETEERDRNKVPKIPKWFKRSSSRHSLDSPIISISTSSSTRSHLENSGKDEKLESVTNFDLMETQVESFNGKGKEREVPEGIEDWLSTEAAIESSPNPHKLSERSSSTSSSVGGNSSGGRFSIKRIKSNSKLFNGGIKSEDRDSNLHSKERNGPYGNAKNGSSSLLSLGSHAGSTRELSARNGNLQSSASGRLGGWFSSMLQTSTSSNLTSLQATPPPISTRTKHASSPFPSTVSTPTSSLGTPARLGPLDRMLDKAVQYLFDTDSNPGNGEEDGKDIWVLGVRHEGFQQSPAITLEEVKVQKRVKKRSKSISKLSFDSQSNTSFSTRPSTTSSISSDRFGSTSSFPPRASITNGWPTSFYSDFYSRLALTYRTGFPIIPCDAGSSGVVGVFNSFSASFGRGKAVGSGPTERGLSSDAGWGCMLRTGQSLLANALMNVHLGRDWRRNLLDGEGTHEQLATYVQILTLFLDVNSPLSPFSVHAFSESGLKLGKAIGEWFGPSTAAGAIKSLVNNLPHEKLKMGVVEANGEIYKKEVEDISLNWTRPVLVLIGVRLGIDGVNPIYHDAIKAIFQFPQSVGIAGGRPSSSYYFVGAQGNSLIYIDPHHSKVAVPMKSPELNLISTAIAIEVGFERNLSPTENQPETVEMVDSFVTIQESSSSSSSSPILPSLETKSSELRLKEFYENAYMESELHSYHCEKVRRMAISSLDPSMLIGFLVKSESDWGDFETRVNLLSKSSKPIFAVADQPPSWMKTSSNSISNRQKIPIPNPRQALSSNGESTGFTTSDDEDTGDNWDNDSTEGEFDDEEVSNRVDEEVFLDSAEFVDTSSQAQRIERRDESYYTALGSPVTTPTVEDDSNFLKVEKDQVMMQE